MEKKETRKKRNVPFNIRILNKEIAESTYKTHRNLACELFKDLRVDRKDLTKQQNNAEFTAMAEKKLSRFFSQKSMPYSTLDKIGELLDRAPEYLSGKTQDFPECVFDYSFHIYQSITCDSVMRDFLIYTGMYDLETYSKMSGKQFWGLMDKLKECTKNYLLDNNMITLNKDGSIHSFVEAVKASKKKADNGKHKESK